MKAKIKRIATADVKEVNSLKLAINALNGTSHNPVEWTPVIKFVAPLIARIAARYAAKYVAGKLNRRLKLGISRDAAEATADKVTDILSKSIKR